MLARASGSGGLAPGMAPIGLGALAALRRRGATWPLRSVPLSGPPTAPRRVRAHAHRDDAVRLGKRQRPERDGVDDGKDCGRGARAQRQHEQRADREAGCRPQCPDGVTQIDEHAVERERARRPRRRRFAPVRLAQRSEKGFESGAIELGLRGVRRVFGRRAAARRALATDPRGAARAPRRSRPHARATSAATQGAGGCATSNQACSPRVTVQRQPLKPVIDR